MAIITLALHMPICARSVKDNVEQDMCQLVVLGDIQIISICYFIYDRKAGWQIMKRIGYNCGRKFTGLCISESEKIEGM